MHIHFPKTLVLTGFVALFILGSAACQVRLGLPGVEGDVYYAGEHQPGAELNTYWYYPDAGVYYYPSARTYYWREGNDWRYGRDLPRQYHVHEHNHYTFRSNARRPYDVNEKVTDHYRGQHQSH